MPARRARHGGGALRLPAIVAGLLLAAGAANALAGAGRPLVSVTASTSELTIGGGAVVSGLVSGGGSPAAGTSLALQIDPYPYRGFATAAHASSTPGGTFAFEALRPDRDTRVRVVPAGGSPSPTLTLTVDPKVSLASRGIGAGETELSLRLRHTSHAGAEPTSAWWYTAPRGSRRFGLVAVTPTHEIAPQVTTARAVVDPPGARFLFRVCLNPPWENAMGPAGSHGACPHRDFTLPRSAAQAEVRPSPSLGELEYGGEARGTPRPAFPSSEAIASAIAFLDGRAGSTSLAIVTSAGRLVGVRVRAHFQTASVIKAMMLVAYLQMLERHHRGLSAGDRALLYPMIHVSDNDAASAVLARVGEGAIERIAHESGMSAYAPGVGWWAFSQTDAADQARFFSELSQLIPHRFYGYARQLMSTIEPSQSWGFPPVARPSWRVYFKTGALPSRGLFHEAALLERGGQSFTVAILTDGDPSMLYGEQTIEGVAQRLLAGTL